MTNKEKELKEEIEEEKKRNLPYNESLGYLEAELKGFQEGKAQTLKDVKEKIEKVFKKKKWILIGEDDEINWDKIFIELKKELLSKLDEENNSQDFGSEKDLNVNCPDTRKGWEKNYNPDLLPKTTLSKEKGHNPADTRKGKIEIYCKNPLCFNHYLANHKIKETKEKDLCKCWHKLENHNKNGTCAFIIDDNKSKTHRCPCKKYEEARGEK